MKKNAFTLVELLVVIAIIGILSVLIVPNLIGINDRINTRLYNQKLEYIESAAQLYAESNQDIFAGGETARVYVYQLLNEGYLTSDVDNSTDNCKDSKSSSTVVTAGPTYNSDNGSTKGCYIDPRNKNSMNNVYVDVTKANVGYTAEVYDPNDVDCTANPTDSRCSGGSSSVNLDTLAVTVCKKFASGEFKGKTLDSTPKTCTCSIDASGNPKLSGGTSCIIVTGDDSEPNNWLRYGDSSSANWRVIGLYTNDGKVVAKIITADPVDLD